MKETDGKTSMQMAIIKNEIFASMEDVPATMTTPPYSSSPSGGGTGLLADFHSLVQQVQNLLEEAAETDEAQHRQLVHCDLRQCVRKLQTILHDDGGDLAARLLVEDKEETGNGRGIHSDEDDDNECRRRELWGFTDDLIQLMTLDFMCEDPSVVQLWKSLVPWAAGTVPTALNTDQLWRVLARVLSTLEEWNSILAGHLSPHTTSLMTNDLPTSGQWHWPPSDLDIAALQGLLDHLITSLEMNPSQLQEIVPALEADVVLVRPLLTVCWSTSLSRLDVATLTSFAPYNSTNDGQDQDQHGVPPEIIVSLRLLIDFLLGNLKATVGEREVAAAGSTLSLRDWLHHKSNQQHTVDSTSTSNSADHNTSVTIPPATEDDILLEHLDQYAMELADEAIRLLHTETRTRVGSTPNKKELDTNDHHEQEKRNKIFKALQYTSMATNFFFHTENDGFHDSPKLQGLSRSLWHAFGEFVLNSMDCHVSSMDYELAATETLFRLTKTQLSAQASNRIRLNSHSDEKELTIVVTTVLRLLDGADWFDKHDIVEWMESLLKDPIYGHKLVMPLQAALLSTLYLPDNRDPQDHEWIVSSLLKWTGLRDVDMNSETTTNDDQSESVNGIWKGYVADQMRRMQG